MFKQWLPALFLVLILAGCTSFLPEAPTAIPADTAIPPPPIKQITTIPPTRMPTQAPTITTTLPQAPKTVVVNTNNLNLRSGPSTLYQILSTYQEGVELEALSRTPGGDWIKIKAPDGITGWMSESLVIYNGDVFSLPEEFVDGGITLHGKVLDDQGTPMDKVALAVTRNLESGANRADVTTTSTGEFYVFLPQGFPGNWQVSMVGVDCESSLVDENCNIRDHLVYYGKTTVTLPPSSTVVILLELATSRISGKIVNAQGEPVGNIQVFAQRSDGAYSYGLPKNNGEFELPASPGKWEVYAISYNPRLEGKRVALDIETGVSPQSVEITAP
jgi:hypothetical protein